MALLEDLHLVHHLRLLSASGRRNIGAFDSSMFLKNLVRMSILNKCYEGILDFAPLFLLVSD